MYGGVIHRWKAHGKEISKRKKKKKKKPVAPEANTEFEFGRRKAVTRFRNTKIVRTS